MISLFGFKGFGLVIDEGRLRDDNCAGKVGRVRSDLDGGGGDWNGDDGSTSFVLQESRLRTRAAAVDVKSIGEEDFVLLDR